MIPGPLARQVIAFTIISLKLLHYVNIPWQLEYPQKVAGNTIFKQGVYQNKNTVVAVKLSVSITYLNFYGSYFFQRDISGCHIVTS